MAIYSLLAEFVTEWNMMMAFSVLASAPLVVAFIFLQRYVVRGMTVGRDQVAVSARGIAAAGALVDVVGLGVNALDLIAVIDGYPEPDTKAPLRHFDLQGGGMTATAMVAVRPARPPGPLRRQGRGRLLGAASRCGSRREGVDVRHVIRVRTAPAT